MDEKTIMEIENEALRKELQELQKENIKLKQIVRENDLDDTDLSMSDEEAICVNEIHNLKKLSDMGSFGREEAQILDILHKNLRMIRGQSTDAAKKGKGKKADVKELFKIVEDKNG